MSEQLNKDNLHKWQGLFYEGLEKEGKSHNTLKNYRTDLECFNTYLKITQKSMDITNFQISHVLEYGAYLENKYNSDNSRRRRVQALRIFFDFLVVNGLFSTNPVRKIPTSPKFLDIPRPTPFIDVKTLWVHLLEEEKINNGMAKLCALRNQVIMLLIFGGGLKVSDLQNLKENDLYLGESPRVLIQHPKRDPYTIPLPPIFNDVMKKYLEELSFYKKEAGLTFDHILFNANPYRILSGGLSPRGLEVVFEDIRKKLMITLTPKSLRQSCIFKWLSQKKNDTSIKEWLGVAPSYSLKLYREHMEQNIFNDEFLEKLYRNHFAKAH